MTHKVGAKGQVVIEKEIRDKLGIKPGSSVLQFVVDGHVELHFIPPPHNRSLFGVLADYVKNAPPYDPETWHEVREQAWAAAARDRWERMREQERDWERERVGHDDGSAQKEQP